jgi:excisionase family DNA binding protein
MSEHVGPKRTRHKSTQEDQMNMDTVAAGDRLMRIKDVAEFLGTSDKTVRRLIYEGKLKSQKLRGLRLIWKSHLLEMLNPVTKS